MLASLTKWLNLVLNHLPWPAWWLCQLEDFTNRIMISLTAQLVLAALFTSTTQSSVRTPYLKLIDVWYAAVITFCFFIIISQTVINVILNRPNTNLRVWEFWARCDSKVNDTSSDVNTAPWKFCLSQSPFSFTLFVH